MKRKTVLILLLCLGWVSFFAARASELVTSADAAELVSQEYQVKAAFLYNFARFIDWPAGALEKANGVFVIGIVGEDPFGSDIDELFHGKTINNLPIEVRRYPDIQSIGYCQILFVNVSSGNAMGKVIGRVEDRNTLTVGDSASFVQNGGMVGFVIEDRKVRFEINKDAVDRAGLHVSAQLLKLARLVTSA